MAGTRGLASQEDLTLTPRGLWEQINESLSCPRPPQASLRSRPENNRGGEVSLLECHKIGLSFRPAGFVPAEMASSVGHLGGNSQKVTYLDLQACIEGLCQVHSSAQGTAFVSVAGVQYGV